MDGQAFGILIPVAAIVGWYVHSIFSEKFQTQREMAQEGSTAIKELLANNVAFQEKIQSSLDQIEKRLEQVEKVLSEIPS
ncbi:hypothetical protein [Dyella sp. RRB7]|uniref:hypothetical protein n=1 Tax=Dyella sp. RRB7 TaxID=2919502 RepID=UPI001FAA0315|nr:hypothetical protein [Dyella sp. RRB7]